MLKKKLKRNTNMIVYLKYMLIHFFIILSIIAMIILKLSLPEIFKITSMYYLTLILLLFVN